MSDVTPFAKALISANPQRVVWGTAWPHPAAGAARAPTDLSPHRQVDDGRAMNMLPVWVPDAATRRMILVENPARLYWVLLGPWPPLGSCGSWVRQFRWFVRFAQSWLNAPYD